MTTSQQKVALVTGASSGIGEATALDLHNAGFVVYGVARRTDRMQAPRDCGIETLAMEVTDEESTALAVKQILAEASRIDLLVNNAGYGSYGAVEDVALKEARRQFEVNLFGAARLMQLVLPTMRDRGSGTIINISSMGGKIYGPFGAWYHGTKFALEAVSDCLRIETKPFGIDVVVIEPGGIRTEWPGIAADHLRKMSGGGAYADQAGVVADTFTSEATAKRSSPPEVIAKTVTKAATEDSLRRGLRGQTAHLPTSMVAGPDLRRLHPTGQRHSLNQGRHTGRSRLPTNTKESSHGVRQSGQCSEFAHSDHRGRS